MFTNEATEPNSPERQKLVQAIMGIMYSVLEEAKEYMTGCSEEDLHITAVTVVFIRPELPPNDEEKEYLNVKSTFPTEIIGRILCDAGESETLIPLSEYDN